MHINRSIRRLARMTGAEPPSAHSLEQRLEKRVLSVEGPEGLRRRFNRFAVPPSPNEIQLNKRFNRNGTAGTAGILSTSLTSVKFANPPTAPNSLGLDIEYVLGYKILFRS